MTQAPSSSSSSIGPSLERQTGYLGIIGGIALAAAYLTHPPSAPPETVASTGWLWIHAGFMVSLVFGVFLLVALLSRCLRHGGGMTGVIGFVMAVTSLIFVAGLDYSEIFIFPTLAVEFPDVVTKYGDGTSMPSVAFAFPITGVFFLIGFVLFGWELKKTGALPSRTAYLLIAGTIVFGIGLSGVFPMIVVRLGATIFGAALMAVGVDLLKHPAKASS